MDEPRLTVSAAARRLGIAPATLRTWDRRYGIGPTDHARGHHRRYSADDMARLELMQHALVQGASPAEAARYAHVALPRTHGPDGRPRPPADREVPVAPAMSGIGSLPVDEAPEAAGEAAGASDVPAAPERAVRAGGGMLRMPGAGPRARGLGRAALAMDPVLIRTLLDESVVADGLLATWDDVARPVLGAVGQRWAATGRGVEVEHLLSDCLMVVFGAQVAAAPPPRNPRPVLLAAMPDDLHTVPLAALAAVLAERRVGCRFLGAALPGDALGAAVRRTAPAAVVLWAQVPETADTAVVATLPVTRPRFRTYVAGPGWAGVALPPGVDLLGSLAEAGDRVGAAVLH